MLVALVDDDRTTNFLNTHLFRKVDASIEIHCFSNGKEILESDMLFEFDYILLDMNMPVMGGMEFLKELQLKNESNNPNVVVVLPDISQHNFTTIQNDYPFVSGKINKPLTQDHIQQLFNAPK